ncbi:MAG: hypothetical protein KDD01_00095, partial [Phaeodactylibacter sp.]|nr:hypothetical protein [Phaeodactylibacter sp.]
LEYQVHKIQTTIQELEKQAAEVQEVLYAEEAKALPSATKPKAAAAESAPKVKRKGPGRPPKAKSAATTKTTAKEPAAKKEEVKEPETKKPATKRTKTTTAAKKDTTTTGKKRGPGRPPKAASEKKSTKAAKKESPKDTDSNLRLSDWDEFVIKSLQSKQQALITKDFLEIAKANPDIKSGEAQVKVKLNRSLHKLANKKGALVKVEHSGRGFAYALSEWVNNKGELPKKYAR